MLFFASIGLTANLVLLRQGGVRLRRFPIALFPFLLVQNGLGLTIARILGLHPALAVGYADKRPPIAQGSGNTRAE